MISSRRRQRTAAKTVEAMLKTAEPTLPPEIAKPQEHLERKLFEKEQVRWLRGEYDGADMNHLLKAIIKHVLAQCIHYATCAEIIERCWGDEKDELAKLLAKLPREGKAKGILIDRVVDKAKKAAVDEFNKWHRSSGAVRIDAHTAGVIRRYIEDGAIEGAMGLLQALKDQGDEETEQ
jgi:hypothetical protein